MGKGRLDKGNAMNLPAAMRPTAIAHGKGAVIRAGTGLVQKSGFVIPEVVIENTVLGKSESSRFPLHAAITTTLANGSFCTRSGTIWNKI